MEDEVGVGISFAAHTSKGTIFSEINKGKVSSSCVYLSLTCWGERLDHQTERKITLRLHCLVLRSRKTWSSHVSWRSLAISINTNKRNTWHRRKVEFARWVLTSVTSILKSSRSTSSSFVWIDKTQRPRKRITDVYIFLRLYWRCLYSFLNSLERLLYCFLLIVASSSRAIGWY
jgi:hypothetical protein